jgi:integrase
MVLKLRRRKGSRNWYVRGTIRGIAVDETTGVADRAIAEAIRARREWECFQQSVFGPKATATFAEAARSYIANGGEERFLGLLLGHFGDLPLAAINQRAIDDAAARLYPTAASSTINRQVHSPVSAVLRHAAKRGLCDAFHIERPPQARGRIRWLTPVDAERLIASCASHLRPLVLFLFYTGARLSEALYLDWNQVDLVRGEVQFLETKNGDARGVPLHPRLIIELKALHQREGTVFRLPNGGVYVRKTYAGSRIRTAFAAACRRASISDFTPHDCRHTWATWHYAANRDLVSLMALGGWRSERMALRYAHANVSHLAESIAALPWNSEKKADGAAGKD